MAIHGRKGRSGHVVFEVHSALPMLLLHLSGANYCATSDTGLVQTQDDRWVPTFGVVRAQRQYGEARRVSRGQRKVEIAPIDDACGLHNAPFRSAPTNICTSMFSHARGVMLQAVASDARPWACCRGDARAERQVQ